MMRLFVFRSKAREERKRRKKSWKDEREKTYVV